MIINVNGKETALQSKMTLKEYLESGNFPASIAVERNGRVISKEFFAAQILEDGDILEVVGFVGGG